VCNLKTGPLKQHYGGATHSSSTIEMSDFDRDYDVAVIDEIQLINDPHRGHNWRREMSCLFTNMEGSHLSRQNKKTSEIGANSRKGIVLSLFKSNSCIRSRKKSMIFTTEIKMENLCQMLIIAQSYTEICHLSQKLFKLKISMRERITLSTSLPQTQSEWALT
jgi:hypothetical protein